MDERLQLVERLELFFEQLFSSVETEAFGPSADLELSFSQVRITMLLHGVGSPMPINEIGSCLGISIGTTGRNVDRLVELGLVHREECPSDRRVKMVSLSPDGAELINDHFQARHRALHAFINRLPDDQVRAFAEALDPILAGNYLRPESAATHSLTQERVPQQEAPGAQ